MLVLFCGLTDWFLPLFIPSFTHLFHSLHKPLLKAFYMADYLLRSHKEYVTCWWMQINEWLQTLCVLSHFSHVQLFATPWTVAHQAPLSMQNLQARILVWVTISSSRGSFWPRTQTLSLTSPALAGRFFTTSTIWEVYTIRYRLRKLSVPAWDTFSSKMNLQRFPSPRLAFLRHQYELQI